MLGAGDAVVSSRCWLGRAVAAKSCGLRTFTFAIHYEDISETEREARYVFTGWSAQRDRHGAFTLKPSEARFQLVYIIIESCQTPLSPISSETARRMAVSL